MEKIQENNGINCLEYAIIHTDKRLCDTCPNVNGNCAKLLFAGDDYICAEKKK